MNSDCGYRSDSNIRYIFAPKNKIMRIGIIGCGNLGFSLLNGIRVSGGDYQVVASKRSMTGNESERYAGTVFTTNNKEVLENSDLVIVALKPYNVLKVLNEIKENIDPNRHTIVSVATGISIDEISNAIGGQADVFRAMPNTAAAVNESITAISFSNDQLGRKNEVNQLFKNLGETVFIDESLMESATILGACGVAYVLRFMRAMIQGGIQVGFDADTATKIVSQTMKGAAELIIKNGSHPEEEIDKVTTPRGCTIVGLNEMEHAGFSSALIKGIVASYEKIER